MPNYIDRDVAIEMITKDAPDLVYYNKEEAIACLKCVPTADVQEVKHAKWLLYRFGLEVVTCSICGAVYEGGDSFRFCPKCGAKMDLEER